MSECTHDCSSCGENCSSRNGGIAKKSLREGATVRKVIAVVSGKGGVGKSMTTALLASYCAKLGYRTAILDADITGPSIPKMFGTNERAMGREDGAIYPVLSKQGIQMMSMNLLLEEDTQPVVWRGALIGGCAVQFWTDVLWDDVDYMFVDMPPGTGDVPLSVYQSLPIDGIVVVSTPQSLVKMIVEKAVNMAEMMNVPVLGIVENMSYIACPDCGKKIELFGESKAEALAREFSVPVALRMPLDPALAKMADEGNIYDADSSAFEEVFSCIEKS